MIKSTFKKLFWIIVTLILSYYINPILNIYLPKLVVNFGWLYSVIIKIISFNINLLALIVSVTLVFCIYKITYYIILTNKNFRIIRATYGTDNKYIDITDRLNDAIVDNKLEIQLTNNIAGKDPVPHVLKYANIKYKDVNEIIDIKVKEYETIKIPLLKN